MIIMRIRSCQQCQRAFSAQGPAKYCSDACKLKAYRRRVKPDTGTSNEHRVRGAETRKNTWVPFHCEVCGRDTFRTISQGNQQYCSDACKQKAYRARKQAEVARISD